MRLCWAFGSNVRFKQKRAGIRACALVRRKFFVLFLFPLAQQPKGCWKLTHAESETRQLTVLSVAGSARCSPVSLLCFLPASVALASGTCAVRVALGFLSFSLLFRHGPASGQAFSSLLNNWLSLYGKNSRALCPTAQAANMGNRACCAAAAVVVRNHRACNKT